MTRKTLASVALVAVVARRPSSSLRGGTAGRRRRAPMRCRVFEVDASWPQLPNNWVLGQVPGIAVDRRDHVWILHRPRTVPEADREPRRAGGARVRRERASSSRRGAGPGNGYDWPDSEHGIFVDHKDNVWIGGSSPTSQSLTRRSDDMLLKFTQQGQVPAADRRPATRAAATRTPRSVNKPADVFVYAKTNEVFVADGYGNRRVIVFDADTGAFKRMWGAFGNAPIDAPPAPRRRRQPRRRHAAAGGAQPRLRAGSGTPLAERGAGAGRERAPLDTDGPGRSSSAARCTA